MSRTSKLPISWHNAYDKLINTKRLNMLTNKRRHTLPFGSEGGKRGIVLQKTSMSHTNCKYSRNNKEENKASAHCFVLFRRSDASEDGGNISR